MPSAILGTVDAVMTITGKVHTLKSSYHNTATDIWKDRELYLSKAEMDNVEEWQN